MSQCNYSEACAVRATKTWNNRDMNRAFILLLRYFISGIAPKRKKAASLCLRSLPGSISKLLYLLCARKFC